MIEGLEVWGPSFWVGMMSGGEASEARADAVRGAPAVTAAGCRAVVHTRLGHAAAVVAEETNITGTPHCVHVAPAMPGAVARA